MGIQWSINGKAAVAMLVYSGSVSAEEFSAAMEDVFRDADYKPGFGFLVDRRAAEPPSDEYREDAVAFAMRHERQLRGARWAVVVSDEALEAARGGKDLAKRAHLAANIQVFHDVASARDWLLLTAPDAL